MFLIDCVLVEGFRVLFKMDAAANYDCLLPIKKVRVEGLEPPCLAAPDPKSGMSANFTTPAFAALRRAGPPVQLFYFKVPEFQRITKPFKKELQR